MRQAPSLVHRARSIFEDLGYTVEGNGVREFRAQRAWKEVTVTAVAGSDTAPSSCSEGLRCFVTEGDTEELRRELRRSDPEYEYAIIALEDGGYEVVRAPPAGR